ncbi:MAG TPA: hypothetical protein EYQ73_07880 [Candidatus Poseidoniales archaeon]|nr:MAG: hypothetical protein CXT71_02870 [Euryarchaeota archaeon]HIF46690.1 hypothetical protein [Candidatus Poseidoniales archaeon]HIL65487.1 hypothetical protein [Candidatus Poseidoniales archaeon]
MQATIEMDWVSKSIHLIGEVQMKGFRRKIIKIANQSGLEGLIFNDQTDGKLVKTVISGSNNSMTTFIEVTTKLMNELGVKIKVKDALVVRGGLPMPMCRVPNSIEGEADRFDLALDKLDRMGDALDRMGDGLDRMTISLDRINTVLIKILDKLEVMDNKLDLMNNKLDLMNNKLDMMNNKLDSMNDKLDSIDGKSNQMIQNQNLMINLLSTIDENTTN